MCACVRACMCACMRACVHACVCGVCVCVGGGGRASSSLRMFYISRRSKGLLRKVSLESILLE